ncbi:hypothetical protein HKD37_01G000795 [Glycine soja]
MKQQARKTYLHTWDLREAHEAIYAMCCNIEQAWDRVRLVRMHGPKFSTIIVTASLKFRKKLLARQIMQV